MGYSGAGDRDGLRLAGAVLGYTPDPVCRVSSPMSAVALVRTGLGICIVPVFLNTRQLCPFALYERQH
ncbi:hypothetical protein [Martelella mediterranea]|uniref:hypothetical protein n=1 Tax=Martelella mediterranea TaxID=293089 RepID=UPI0010469626